LPTPFIKFRHLDNGKQRGNAVLAFTEGR
jgi:hypothetical protein